MEAAGEAPQLAAAKLMQDIRRLGRIPQCVTGDLPEQKTETNLAQRLRARTGSSLTAEHDAELAAMEQKDDALPMEAAGEAPQLANDVAEAMAPKTGTTRSSVGQPAEPPGGAAQPASLPLRELNNRSAQFGTWAVVVQQAQVFEESS